MESDHGPCIGRRRRSVTALTGGNILALIARLRQLEALRDVDPLLQARIVAERVRLRALQALELKAMRDDAGDRMLMASTLKVLGTEAMQRIDALACDMQGPAAWAMPNRQTPVDKAVAVPRYLNDRAASIYAGSNEIQRDLIAKALLR